MMQCKRCKTPVDKEELQKRFQRGLGHCPNPHCLNVNWELTRKYDRVIVEPSEFEERITQ